MYLTEVMTISRRFIFIILLPLAVLLIPLIAMQFTSEVDWRLSDFLIAGGLLIGAAVSIDLVSRRAKKPAVRTMMVVLILALLALVWAELAVGIFGI